MRRSPPSNTIAPKVFTITEPSPLNDLQIAEGRREESKVDVETTAQKLRLLGSWSITHPASWILSRHLRRDHRPTGHQCGRRPGRWLANPFTISDLSDVWIVCDVYENDLPSVRLGDTADIRLNAYPDQVVKGKISNIGAVLDPPSARRRFASRCIIPAHAPGHVRHRDVPRPKRKSTRRFRRPRFCICTIAIGSTSRAAATNFAGWK